MLIRKDMKLPLCIYFAIILVKSCSKVLLKTIAVVGKNIFNVVVMDDDDDCVVVIRVIITMIFLSLLINFAYKNSSNGIIIIINNKNNITAIK